MNNNYHFSSTHPITRKDLESINTEILALEELILACLIKHADKTVANLEELHNLCSNIIFYRSIFVKMAYIYQVHCHCSYATHTSFFSREEESLLIKVHAYYIDNLDVKAILAKHKRLSYILYLQKQLDRFAETVGTADLKEADIYTFLSDMQDSFASRFNFIDDKIITQHNLVRFVDDLFFDQDGNIISTGYNALDYHISGGMRVGDIIIVAAQPGSAKTMMCLNMFCNNISTLRQENKKLLYFCPDMHMRYLYRRIWSIITGNSQASLKHAERSKIISDMDNLPLIASESANLEDIIRIINYYNKQVKIIIIDYIQLLYSNKYTGYSKHEQIAKIITELKKVIREHNILLILVSQINREAHKTQSLSITHLKDSSSLEQDSDLVFLLSNTSQSAESSYESTQKSAIKLVLGKNRHGRQNMSFNFVMNKENFRITHDKKEEIKTRNIKADDPVFIE